MGGRRAVGALLGVFFFLVCRWNAEGATKFVSWGVNDHGQLGDSSRTDRPAPVEISGLTDIAAIAVGGYHVLALKTDGTLYGWGRNDHGQLGDGSTVERLTPTANPILSDVSAIAAASMHSVYLKKDKTVWTSGWNYHGELGIDQYLWPPYSATPLQVVNLSDVKAIATGKEHTLALKTDGSVWAWGANANGQLGDDSATDRYAPVQVLGLSGATIVAIGAGSSHSFAVADDGTIYAWGNNYYGQLGNGEKGTRYRAVKVVGLTGPVRWIGGGDDHSLAALEDGSIYAWGNNAFGQLGDPSVTESLQPLKLSSVSSCVKAQAGPRYSQAVAADGSLYAWGYNYYGQLGDGTKTDRPTPTLVGSGVKTLSTGENFSVASRLPMTTLTMGVVWRGTTEPAVGAREVELGADIAIAATPALGFRFKAWRSDGGATIQDPTSPTTKVNLTSPGGATAEFAPLQALAPGMWTWGANEAGQLGIGTRSSRSTPQQIMVSAVSAACGLDHTAAIKSDATLWAWGRNDYGQVGDNSKTARLYPVQVMANATAVSAGGYHTLAIQSDHSLWAWGWNGFGQVGDGTQTDRLAPVQVMTDVIAVSAGMFHSLAVKSDHSLWAWGNNKYGALGDGAENPRMAPTHILGDVAAVSAGWFYSLALKTDGSVWAWGCGDRGQLGDGATLNRLKPVQVMTGASAIAAFWEHSAAVKKDGTLWVWGSNDHGQLGDGSREASASPKQVALTQVRSVAVGEGHTAAVRDDGSLWLWGWNSEGQLGDGLNSSRLSPEQVLPNVSTVACGQQHTAAVLQGIPTSSVEIAVSGDGVTEPAAGTHEPAYGAMGVMATANVGSTFAGWTASGEVSVKDATAAVTEAFVGGAGKLVANFVSGAGADAALTMAVSSATMGTTQPAPGVSTRKVNAPFAIVAQANPGFVFKGWAASSGASVLSAAAASSFAALTAPATLTARFEPTPPATALLTVGTNGNGSVIDPGVGNFQCSTGRTYGLWARPLPGNFFIGWKQTGYAAIENTDAEMTSVTLSGDGGATAFFAQRSATLTVISSLNRSDAVILPFYGTQRVDLTANRRFDLYALPEINGYFFQEWTVRGMAGVVDIANAISVAEVWGDAEIIATYTNVLPELTLAVAPEAGGTVSPEVGAHAVNPRDLPVWIAATPAPGYRFSRWTASSGVVLADALAVRTTIEALPIAGGEVTAEFVENAGPELWGFGGQSAWLMARKWTDTAAFAYNTDLTAIEPGNFFVFARNANASAGNSFFWGSLYEFAMMDLGWDDIDLFTQVVPAPYPELENADIADMSCGAGYVLAVFRDGRLASWGTNLRGRLGNRPPNDERYQERPMEVMADVVATAAGFDSSFAIKTDRSLWGWGSNSRGKLGIGDDTDTPIAWAPTRVMADMVSVACGRSHSLAIKSDGSLWAWGDNLAGELGVGKTVVPDYASSPVQVTALSGVAALAAGGNHSLALAADGTLWAWGFNASGQVGDGTTVSRYLPVRVMADVAAIAAGEYYSLALKKDGSLWGWGSNSWQTLGLDDPGYQPRPHLVRSGALSVKAKFRQTLVFSKPTVSATLTVSVEPAKSGTVTPSGAVAVATGGVFSVAAEPGVGYEFVGWSHSDSAFMENVASAITVASVTGDAELVAHFRAATAPPTGARVMAYTGKGTVSPSVGETSVELGRPFAISAVPAVGYAFEGWALDGGAEVVAPRSAQTQGSISKDGSFTANFRRAVLFWGNAADTEADPTRTQSGARRAAVLADDAASLASGGFHSAFVKNDGSLWTWGSNDFGQLGDRSQTDRAEPARILIGVAAVSLGGWHSLAIATDRSLLAWGSNDRGQLGDGSVANSAAPLKVLSNAVVASAGLSHSLAVDTGGALWSWGANDFGQLGDGDVLDSSLPGQVLADVKTCAAGGSHSLAVKTSGELWAWGANNRGQLGADVGFAALTPTAVMDDVVAVSAGMDHSLALKTDGSVWAWGRNDFGQVGDGSDTDRRAPVQVLTGAIFVAAGGYHSVAIKSDGGLWAWGRNDFGQLGDGSTTNRPAPTRVASNIGGVAAGLFQTLALVRPETVAALTMVVTGNGTTLPAEGQSVVNASSPTDIVAAPKSGYRFSKWSCSGPGTIANPDSERSSVAMSGDVVVTAEFVRGHHSADYNPADWRIDVFELLRVVALFNNGLYYKVDVAGPDGFNPSAVQVSFAPGTYHSADYNPADGRIDIFELARVTTLFNDGLYYKVDAAGPDGYVPANAPL